MKAFRMRIQKFSRPLAILLATVVAIITSIVVANATQTITTPNAVNISYSLAPNTSSALITSATNKSVLVMGCCTTVGDQGVGHVSLLHSPSASITWLGLQSGLLGGPAPAIMSGTASTGGVFIIYIDRVHSVDIYTGSADTIYIHNEVDSPGTRAGNVTLIW